MRMSEGSIESTGDEIHHVGLDDDSEYPPIFVRLRGVDEENWPELGYFENERFEPRGNNGKTPTVS